MRHPVVDIVNTYLEKSGYYLNKEEVALQISSHNDFPNLIAVSDLFHHFGIDHFALKMQKEKSLINNLPNYFLAHCLVNKQPSLVLVEKNANKIRLFYSKNKSRLINIKEFFKLWTGVIISFKEVARAKKSIQFKKRVLSGTLIFFISVLALFGLFSLQPTTIQLTWLLTSILGFTTGVFIIQHELGYNVRSIDKICTAFENSSCNAVINSSGASLFGIFKLSDLVIIYFLTHILFTITVMLATNVFITLAFYSSIISIFFIAYSLIYQGFIIKKWCPLCLATAGVLIFQVALTIFSFNTSLFLTTTTSYSLLVFTGLLALITLFWLFVAPLLQKSSELKKLSFEHLKFKRNFNFFNSAFREMPIVPGYIKSANDITLGNENANFEVTLITNPKCYYCINVHNKVIENLLMAFGDQIKITILFNIVNSNKDNKSSQIANYFINIYNLNGQSACLKAMSQFYNDTKKSTWLTRQEQIQLKNYNNLLNKHHKWCRAQGINFTPSLIINNQLYPKKYYKTEELSYFVGDLINQNKTLEP